MVMSLATLAWLAQRTARHAILTQLTEIHNARHVMLGLYLIEKGKTVNFNATLLLSLTGLLEYAANALVVHS